MNVGSVLETAIYVDDLRAAERFYVDVVGLEKVAGDPARHLFLRCGAAMFLVFNAESTSTAVFRVGESDVPMHGATGPGHAAFRVEEDQIDAWRSRLLANDIVIESEVEWPEGGHSIYVRDPAGNSIEFATPALWKLP